MRFYLKARNGIWYISWTVDGRPDRKSTRTRDRGEAELALARHVLEHAQPREQRLANVTVQAVLARYWQHHGQKFIEPALVKHVIGRSCDYLDGVTLDRLTIPTQERFIAGLKPGTARRYLGVIRAALEWAAARQEIEYAPRILRV